MNSKHYLLRVYKMKTVFLILEYASFFGILKAIKELETKQIVPIKSHTNGAYKLEIECCLTGHQESEHIGTIFLQDKLKIEKDANTLKQILIANRLD